ncbi:MAG: hypothetical protein KGI25_10035, partial [Thaumarchaeota archaeon]|nr:hypothetical protein [Nitrososphaerota archaeon]
LISFVAVLMMITSMGIFGFLSNAYQDNVLPLQEQQQQISLLEGEKTESEQLKAERLARQEQINKQIADLPSNFVNGRRRLIAANKSELDQINKDVAQYTTDIREHTLEIAKLKSQTLEETAHVGPIIFMAKAFGMDVNTATKWLIMLIIFVFDPLAVTLTIASNMAILDYKKKKEEAKMPTDDTKVETSPNLTAAAWNFPPVELAEPPVYNADHTLRASKDGMLWTPVAPDAAAAPPVHTNWGEGQTSWANSTISGAAPAPGPGPFTTVTIGEPQSPEPPNLVRKAFDVFTQTDLSPQEKRMKEELETLLKRHQEVLSANATRAKS